MAIKKAEGRFVTQNGEAELAVYLDLATGFLKVKDSEGNTELLSNLISVSGGGNNEYIATFASIPEASDPVVDVFKNTTALELTWSVSQTGQYIATVTGDVVANYTFFVQQAFQASQGNASISCWIGTTKEGNTQFVIDSIDQNGARGDFMFTPVSILIVEKPS